MAGQPFQFKQFAVAHHRATMPVGTDAVLLGAWAFHLAPKQILDVGTGSGVIALMLAQRYEAAIITALDLDAASVDEANENFTNAPFSGRLSAIQADFKSFEPSITYDLIVSNPPYFNTKIKPQAENRSLARNTETLPYAALLKGVSRMLNVDGCFCCVLPVTAIKEFILEAELVRLKANKLLYIKHNTKQEASVALMRFSFNDKPLQMETLILYTNDGKPYEVYRELVKEFYLMG